VGSILPVDLDFGVDLNAFYDRQGLKFFHGTAVGTLPGKDRSPRGLLSFALQTRRGARWEGAIGHGMNDPWGAWTGPTPSRALSLLQKYLGLKNPRVLDKVC
jgi:hypothetical protein